MPKGRILVVEDDESLRRATDVLLQKAGYTTTVAADLPEALGVLRESPQDLVLTDLNLPGPSGLDLVKAVHTEYPDTVVVVITAYATVETAVEAMKLGAYDYLAKPVLPHDLRTLVSRALERSAMLEEIRLLKGSIDRKCGFENIIGASPTLLNVVESARRASQTDATILIRGRREPGRRCWRRPFTSTAIDEKSRSSWSTAARSHTTCSNPICSGTFAARSRAR